MNDPFFKLSNAPGKVAGDKTMNLPLVKTKANTSPTTIQSIRVENITVGKRLRPISQKIVAALFEDIQVQGLLQPIGVREDRERTNRYQIVYGAHRFAAFQRGWAEACQLLDTLGTENPEARRAAMIWESIPAIVFSSEMPNDFMVMKEISENLVRADLSTKQKQEMIVKYTTILKKHKLDPTINPDQAKVAHANKVRAKRIAKAKTSKTEVLPVHDAPEGLASHHDAEPVDTPPPKQTIRETVAKDLNKDASTITRAHQAYTERAREAAVLLGEDPDTVKPVTTVSNPEDDAEAERRIVEANALRESSAPKPEPPEPEPKPKKAVKPKAPAGSCRKFALAVLADLIARDATLGPTLQMIAVGLKPGERIADGLSADDLRSCL